MPRKIIEDKNEILKIVESNSLCTLSIINKEGLPYGVPMSYGIDGDTIVFHSGPKGQMIESLKQNPNVCVTICEDGKVRWINQHIACSYSMEAKSVIIQGKVQFIEDYDTKVEYLNKLMKHYTDADFKYNAPAVKNVVMFTLKSDQWSARHVGAPANKKK